MACWDTYPYLCTYDSGGGKDYTVLGTWEAASDVDLSGYGILILDCYDSQVHDDRVAINGISNSDWTHHRQIQSASGCSTPFDGTVGSGAQISSTDGSKAWTLSISEAHFVLKEISVKYYAYNSTGNTDTVLRTGTSGEYAIFVNCIFYQSENTYSSSVCDGLKLAHNALAYNCIAIDMENNGFCLAAGVGEIIATIACTACSNGGEGFNIQLDSETLFAFSCYSFRNTGDSFTDTSWDAPSNYNGSDDDKAPGANSTHSIDLITSGVLNSDCIAIGAFTYGRNPYNDVSAGNDFDDFLKNDGDGWDESKADIAGVARPNPDTADTDWAVGASQYLTVLTIATGIDALLKRTGITGTTGIDALLMKTLSINVSIDGILSFLRDIDVNIDAIIKATDSTIVSNIDALLKQNNITSTTNIDALLSTLNTFSANIDALLKRTGITGTTDIDAVLKALGITSTANIDALLSTSSSTYSLLDALLSKSYVDSVSVDALLRSAGISISTSIDALLKALGIIVTTNLDAILISAETGIATVSIDALLQNAGVSFSCNIDALLLSQGLVRTISIDSLLQKGYTYITSIDALLQTMLTSNVSIDSLLQYVNLISTTNIDALLQQEVLKSIALDALLQKGYTTSILIDAILVSLRTIATSLDGILVASRTVQVNMDALLQKASTFMLYLDAVLRSSTIGARYTFKTTDIDRSFETSIKRRVFRAPTRDNDFS